MFLFGVLVMELKELQDPKKHPYMVKWFNLGTLIGAAKKAFISSMFGTYADGRLVQVILGNPNDGKPIDINSNELPYGSSDEIWIDFVADVGDGFDSTYTIAHWLSRPEIEINGQVTKRGEILLMGGDQVYPTPTIDEYLTRFENPYIYANPKNNQDANPPLMFLLPGNHDWYDGLDIFKARYCNGQGFHLGPRDNQANWKIKQSRSYFALKLPMNWWILGIDSQLANNIDPVQEDYFLKIAKANKDTEAKIILCVSSPLWLKADSKNDDESKLYKQTIEHITSKINKAWDFKITFYLLLTGDNHHYCRYTLNTQDVDQKIKTEFITAGGGGAFLHPTHYLKNTIHNIDWLGNKVNLNLGIKSGSKDELACFPSQSESKNLCYGNKYFLWTNWNFALLMGGWYSFLILMLSEPTQFHILASIFFGLISLKALYEYSLHDDVDVSKKKKRYFFVGHAAFHGVGIACTFWIYEKLLLLTSDFFHNYFAIGMILDVIALYFIGGIIGGGIWGIYLLISSLLNAHSNDAFSAMSIDGYKNFVRLCLKKDGLKIYPVGIRKVPQRKDWNIDAESEKIVYPNIGEMQPFFIEEPFEK